MGRTITIVAAGGVLLLGAALAAKAISYCPENDNTFLEIIMKDPNLEVNGKLVDWGTGECWGPGGKCIDSTASNGTIKNCILRGDNGD